MTGASGAHCDLEHRRARGGIRPTRRLDNLARAGLLTDTTGDRAYTPGGPLRNLTRFRAFEIVTHLRLLQRTGSTRLSRTGELAVLSHLARAELNTTTTFFAALTPRRPLRVGTGVRLGGITAALYLAILELRESSTILPSTFGSQNQLAGASALAPTTLSAASAPFTPFLNLTVHRTATHGALFLLDTGVDRGVATVTAAWCGSTSGRAHNRALASTNTRATGNDGIVFLAAACTPASPLVIHTLGEASLSVTGFRLSEVLGTGLATILRKHDDPTETLRGSTIAVAGARSPGSPGSNQTVDGTECGVADSNL